MGPDYANKLKKHLIVFTCYPEPGKTKTRLIPLLGAEGAADLQPTKGHLPVKRFVHPKEFDNWREIALKMGFAEVASGPFVRSSYQAQKLYQAVEP